VAVEVLFFCSVGKQGGPFSVKRQQMKTWSGTEAPGQKGQTRGSVLSRDTDVRDETKDVDRCSFTDL
jgi:hypothetical protein